MVAHNVAVVGLLLGLLLGVAFIVRARRRVGGETPISRGAFNGVCAFAATAPALFIKINIIEQTATTVSLAVVYFLVFIIGSTVVNSRAFRQDHQRRI